MHSHQADHPTARHTGRNQGDGGKGEHRDVHELVDRQAAGGDRRCPRGVQHGELQSQAPTAAATRARRDMALAVWSRRRRATTGAQRGGGPDSESRRAAPPDRACRAQADGPEAPRRTAGHRAVARLRSPWGSGGPGGDRSSSKVEHSLQHFLWTDLPEACSARQQAPWWLVIVLLVTGALITFVAEKLPGARRTLPAGRLRARHRAPRDPLSDPRRARVACRSARSWDRRPRSWPSAPPWARWPSATRQSPVRQVMMIAGGMAAVGAIFGNPWSPRSCCSSSPSLAGGALASLPCSCPRSRRWPAATSCRWGSSLVRAWARQPLGLPGLPPYPDVQFIDLAGSIPLAIVVAIVAIRPDRRRGGRRGRQAGTPADHRRRRRGRGPVPRSPSPIDR